MESTIYYQHGIRVKMSDPDYRGAVSFVLRRLVLGMFILVFVTCLLYVLLYWPGLKSSSLKRFTRLKTQADLAYELCIDPLNETSISVHARERAIMPHVDLCVTPLGILRCNESTMADFVETTAMECDEDTVYYHQMQDVQYEARMDALLRLIHLEGLHVVCGVTCLDILTDSPLVCCCLLTVALLVVRMLVSDCNKGHKRIKEASHSLATRPPMLFQSKKQD